MEPETNGVRLMPSVEARWEDKLGYLKNAREASTGYLKAQRAWRTAIKGFDIIADDRSDPSDPSLSRVRFNPIKRGVREIVSTLANLRVIPNYKTENEQFKTNQTNILNKRYLAWHQNSSLMVAENIKKALQWGAVCGRGYVYLPYRRQFVISGPTEIYPEARGPFSVLPYGIGPEHNIQRAYQVTICHEWPYFQAAAMFPTKADVLARVAKPSSLVRSGLRPASNANWIQRTWASIRGKDLNEPESFPLCYLFETYTLDGSMNETGEVLHMGAAGSTWEYYVYPKGGQMPTGVFDEKTGQEFTREVRDEDAMLYPTRRVTFWCDTEDGILEDGPSHWAHGYVPLVDFQLDPWPWEFLGYPLTHDPLALQRSVRDGLRAVDDYQGVVLRPPLAYAKNRVSRNFMKSFDPRVPMTYVGIEGLTIGDLKQIIAPIIPQGSQALDVQKVMEYLKSNEARIDRMMGVMDMLALAKARQMPAGDTIDKMVELMGPVAADMSKSMDASIINMAEMMKFNFLQFDNLKRRYEILGEDGISKEDFDYDPGNMIPQPEQRGSQLRTLWNRIRDHGNQFTYQITPGSLHEITSMTRRLILFQLYRTPNFPLDPWTLAEAFNITLGPKPPNCNTTIELWAEWQKIMAAMAAQLRDEFGGGGAQASGPHGGRAGTGGRPPVGGHAPQVKSRPNGGSTIQQSR
jgi:hypothetical protein